MHLLEEYFRHGQYFSANALARVMGRLAEEEIAVLGFSPSQAFCSCWFWSAPVSCRRIWPSG